MHVYSANVEIGLSRSAFQCRETESASCLRAGSVVSSSFAIEECFTVVHRFDLQDEAATQIYTGALFLWLQLILLRPLQPVMTGLDGSLATRLQHLARISAATFLLFCCPLLGRKHA